MRSLGSLFFFCLVSSWPLSGAVLAAPPATVTELQEQLRQEQKAANLVDKQITEFLNKYQSLSVRYGGDFSGVRLARDRQSDLKQARNDRALRYWESLEIPATLQQPLSETQLAEVATFIEWFGESSLRIRADSVMAEHKRLIAAGLLAELKLGSLKEVLTEQQVAGLLTIDKDFSTTEAGTVARQYLLAHFSRQAHAEAMNAAWLATADLEALAMKRLTEVRRTHQDPLRLTRLRQALDEIVVDFPGTAASRHAESQSQEVQATMAAISARTQSVRDYWDATHAGRTKSLPAR